MYLTSSRSKSTTSVTSRPLASTSFSFDPVPFDPFSTPEPPTTPSSAPAYECRDEGFFPHTTSCKKYFWCLDVPGSGMVAHTFTCPQGLYFNSLTDGCDFRRNVDCEGKDDTEEDPEESTTTRTTQAEKSSTKSGEGESLEDVLSAIKEAGGVEAFELKLRLEEEERQAAKQAERERLDDISKKTRSRLTELLERKRAQVLHELSRNSAETESPKVEILGFVDEESEEGPVTLRPNRFRPEAGIRKRLRSRLHEVLEDQETLDSESADRDNTKEQSTSTRVQNAARPDIASLRQRNPALSSESTTESPVTPRTLEYVTIDRGSTRDEDDNPFVTPLPVQLPEEEETELPRSGQLGSVRDLEYVTIQRGPPPPSSDGGRPESNRFGGGSRGGNFNQLSEDEESESRDPVSTFRATPAVPSNTNFKASPAVPDTTTVSPNIRASLLFLTNPNLSEEDDFEDSFDLDTTTTTSTTTLRPFVSSTSFRQPPVVTTFRPLPAVPQTPPPTRTFPPRVAPTRQQPLPTGPGLNVSPQPETSTLRPEEELFNNVLKAQEEQAVVTRPKVDPLNRPRQRQRPEPSRPRSRPETPRRLEQPELIIKTMPQRRPTLPNDPVRFRSRQPLPVEQPRFNPVTPRVHPFSTSTEPSSPLPIVTLPQLPAQPAQPVSRPRVPAPVKPAFTKVSPDGDYIYEYVYEYEDADNDYEDSVPAPALVDTIGDYDLNPLTNKVQILDNGKPVCRDVGVFPHPGSCRKFITCSRRAIGSGIVGWVYECPSYLAFDPVGGRCNWANEFVCAERRHRY